MIYLFIYLEIHSFICSTREILKTSVCNMKSDELQPFILLYVLNVLNLLIYVLN